MRRQPPAGFALLRLAFALLAVLSGFLRPGAAAGPAPRDEIVYQIFFRSFRDSNGDRVGDLTGLRRELGYLGSLGVTSILLTPIQPSPFYHNYFASNFEGVDPAYGTMEDFRALVRAVHARGMRLYLDEEIQYVTFSHPWLRDSLGRPGSKYGRYLIYNGPGNTDPEPGFLGLRTLRSYDGRTYDVATVNLRDPAVLAYFQRLFVSWIDPHGDRSLRDGVDGFRIDHMMDDLDGKGKLKNLFATFWRPVFRSVRSVNPDATIIAEQADWGYGADWLDRGGVDRVFAFPLRGAIVSFDKAAIVNAAVETGRITRPGKAALTFIENHDVSRFASEVGGSLAKEKIGAAFDLLLRGVPLIYYGQEIGMRGVQSRAWGSDANDIPDREAFRWSRDLLASGSATWYRGRSWPWWTGRFNRSGDGVSVEEESGKPGSLLTYYRKLIAIRESRPEIQRGGETIVADRAADAVCFVRTLGSARTLVVLNLSAAPIAVTPTLDGISRQDLTGPWVDLLNGGRPAGVGRLKLAPFEILLLATP